MNHTFLWYLLMLCAGHALCDYPLQNDILARGKNKFAPSQGMPYWQLLLAHSLIQAGMVLLVTGSVTLALLELGIHYLTDHLKCAGAITFNEDQAIHYISKLLWAAIAAWGLNG